ncbi:MFS transporter [Pokkaliibacter sp. CJK22405]|uniref:MFS transporter n=1 Tax=Pokkaliibacter sp. CJK22405 TaxID=3384615 RepID=UPI003984A77A
MSRPTIVTLVIFCAYFMLGHVSLVWGVILPAMSTELAMSKVFSGTFFMVFSLGMVGGAFLGGKYITRFPFLRLFSVLSLILTLLLSLISVVNSANWLLLGGALAGVFSSVMFTIGHTLVAALHAKRRVTMMGLGDFTFSFGTMVVPGLITLLYGLDLDWRWSLRVIATFLILLAIASWWAQQFLPDTLMEGSGESDGQQGGFIALLKIPLFLAMAMAMLGYGAIEWGNGNWFVSYAQDGLGFDGDTARQAFMYFTGGMVISRLGFIILLRWVNIRLLMTLMAILCGVGGFMLKFSQSIHGLELGNGLLGLGLGGLFPMLLSQAMGEAQHKGPLLSGTAVISVSFGAQAFSFLTGWLAQMIGLDNAFWTMPVGALWLCAAVLTFCWLLARARRQPEPLISPTET